MSDNLTSPPENQPERPPRRRQRQHQLSSIQIVFAAILSIGLLLVINFSGRIARGQQMEAARRQLQATIDVLEVEKSALSKERNYAANDISVEHWAHTEGKMVRDGEILVIPIPAGGIEITPTSPSPVLIAAPVSEPKQSTWQLWWNLFFDGTPPF